MPQLLNKVKMRHFLLMSLFFVTASCASAPVIPTGPEETLPPKGQEVYFDIPASIEQCMVQPETYICQQECLSVRASIRAWCAEGYTFDPDTFTPEN